jgi:hypothetical protein
LTAAAGQKRIEGSNAEIDLAFNALARVRRWRARAQKVRLLAFGQRTQTIDRLAEGINDAAPPSRAWANCHLALDYVGAATEANAFKRTERHKQRPSGTEADHLAEEFAGTPALHPAVVADRQVMLHAADLKKKPLHRRHPPIKAVLRNLIQTGVQNPKGVGHRANLKKN